LELQHPVASYKHPANRKNLPTASLSKYFRDEVLREALTVYEQA